MRISRETTEIILQAQKLNDPEKRVSKNSVFCVSGDFRKLLVYFFM